MEQNKYYFWFTIICEFQFHIKIYTLRPNIFIENPTSLIHVLVLEDNIKMDLREIGWCDINWINLAQDRDQWRALVNTLMNLRVP
jgi:hypothetical protein